MPVIAYLPPVLNYCQHNECLQVLFAHETVLVVRARSIQLFPYPELKPYDPSSDYPQDTYDAIAYYSFGWVDGISAAICPYLTTSTILSNMSEPGVQPWAAISILIRGESDDPWTQDEHFLELYTLSPNPDYVYEAPVPRNIAGSVVTTSAFNDGAIEDSSISTNLIPPVSPYVFPPQKIYRIKSRRGPLRCRHVSLGKFGTAAWLEPHERFSTGLVTAFPSFELWSWQNGDQLERQDECARFCVFPGPLSMSTLERDGESEQVQSRKLLENAENNWTCFDYDEVGGRIVFGTSFGKIAVVYLA